MNIWIHGCYSAHVESENNMLRSSPVVRTRGALPFMLGFGAMVAGSMLMLTVVLRVMGA